jgi:hypothetical protein
MSVICPFGFASDHLMRSKVIVFVLAAGEAIVGRLT